ncbi:MAG: UxaA family hydrolase [Burkholderiales bacterium]
MEPFQKVGSGGALLLAPGDNIAVAVRDLAPGDTAEVAGVGIAIRDTVLIGHKFAIRAIARDERIIKYGAPIGRAIQPIAAGEYVHIHNVTSDYLPTYTLDAGHTYLSESH